MYSLETLEFYQRFLCVLEERPPAPEICMSVLDKRLCAFNKWFFFFGNLGILRNEYVSFLYSQMFFEFTHITIKIQSIIYRDVF